MAPLLKYATRPAPTRQSGDKAGSRFCTIFKSQFPILSTFSEGNCRASGFAILTVTLVSSVHLVSCHRRSSSLRPKAHYAKRQGTACLCCLSIPLLEQGQNLVTSVLGICSKSLLRLSGFLGRGIFGLGREAAGNLTLFTEGDRAYERTLPRQGPVSQPSAQQRLLYQRHQRLRLQNE